MKLYVLSKGEYEEWQIVNIFSSLEKLDQFKKDYPDDYDEDYEIHYLDENPRIYKTKDLYYVLFKGNLVEKSKIIKKIYTNTRLVNIPIKCVNDYVTVHVWAKDMNEAIERAKKVCIKKGIF